MASSSFLLAAVALAALFAIGCGAALTFKVGEGSTNTKLVLVPSVAISEVEVKEKGASDFMELKELPAGTWTIDSKTPLKGPFSIHFAAKSGGYRVVDDAIPGDFKARSDYQTSMQL